ncbi:lysozyme inhibitor LprI family protein [Neoroseomonas rubea]|uniref:lysozyme inhibitor LprI family protein n=1 Tax=Neoroseomonas rubea TaxID=2748666 RepID=UPI0018DF860B|nr:lysozyme inhibitor LprI family protein [Roseomonas rubea]
MNRLALLVTLLVLAAPSLAQRAPDTARPLPAERAWLEACVLSALAHPPRAAFGRCAWRIASTCQGDPGEGLLIARLPPTLPGRPLPAAACVQIEAALWQQQMERWLRELGLLAPAAQQEPLRRAQRAFMAFRDAGCAAERALAPPAEAMANEASCRLETTALRALDLKRLRDEMWLLIAAASVEGP